MNAAENNIYCNQCGQAFKPAIKETMAREDGIALFGQPVYVGAFACPSCGKIYVYSVMTEDMKKKLQGVPSRSKRKRIVKEEKRMRELYVKELQKHGDNVFI